MTVIIDADSIPYQCAYVAEKNGYFEDHAKKLIDGKMNQIFKNTNADSYIAVCTGNKNFRYNVTTDYKANRDNTLKEENLYYPILKDYMIKNYKCITVNGAEADDVCTILHNNIEECVLAAIDKDLLQSKGMHYNYNTSKLKYVEGIGTIEFKVSLNSKKKKLKCSGDFALWAQMALGDSVDNIQGIKGVGPVATYKLLKNCKSYEEMEHIIKCEYIRVYKDEASDRFNKAFKLLYMPDKGNIKLPKPITIIYENQNI